MSEVTCSVTALTSNNTIGRKIDWVKKQDFRYRKNQYKNCESSVLFFRSLVSLPLFESCHDKKPLEPDSERWTLSRHLRCLATRLIFGWRRKHSTYEGPMFSIILVYCVCHFLLHLFVSLSLRFLDRECGGCFSKILYLLWNKKKRQRNPYYYTKRCSNNLTVPWTFSCSFWKSLLLW